MAGAEAILPSFPVNKPPIPKRLIRGSKFLKWPKADDVCIEYFNVLRSSFSKFSIVLSTGII